MTLLLIIAALALAGALLGRQRARHTPGRPVLVLRWGIGALVLLALGLPLSNLLGSDTLGWLTALSMLFVAPLLVPFLAAYALGYVLARRGQPADVASPAAEQAFGSHPPTAPQRLSLPPPHVLDLLMAMAAVGAGFVMVIGVGFRFAGGYAPAAISMALWPATLLLAVITGVWLRRWYARRRAAPRFG
ncbi:MAG: hypothetical protein ACKVQR_22385 [Aquabacterium sp.]